MQILEFDYQAIAPKIQETLYSHLGPHIAVETEAGEQGRIFVKVVAQGLNGKTAKEKQDIVWAASETLGPDAQAVALVLAFGTEEI